MTGTGVPAGSPPPPWEAEQFVDLHLARRLIAAQFPWLNRLDVEPLAEGWDHTVYLVGGEWVFRFPRRSISLPGMAREMALLPALAPLLPLPVPVPELLGGPGESYPWQFWGARLVPGAELALVDLDDGERATAAHQVGRFLRVLHDPDTARAVRVELLLDPLSRADSRSVAGRARERLGRLEAAGLYQLTGSATSILRDAEALGNDHDELRKRSRGNAAGLVLVHGDLHLRHLLLGPDGAASGVIDWGDACLADAAVDLSMAYAGFAGTDRAAFFGAYGSVREESEIRARVLAMFLCSALAEHALATGTTTPLRTALAGISRATSD